jgi:hypothetical protein
MLLHQGWFALVVFSNTLAKKTKILVIYLGWDGLSGSHWNFLKRCHNQAKLYLFLALSGNIFLVLNL